VPNAGPTPKAVPSVTTQSSARRVLVECLTDAVGTERAARTFLEVALRSSGLAQVPRTEIAVLDFVRSHMLTMLEDELGHREAAGVVRKIIAGLRRAPSKRSATTAPSVPSKPKSNRSTAPQDRPTAPIMPTKRPATTPSRTKPRPVVPHVALLMADRLQRAGFARELVRAQCEVTAFETVEDVDVAVDVVVVDLRLDDVDEIVREIVARGPKTPFVVIANRDVDVEGRLRPLGVRTFCTATPTTRATTLTKLVTQFAERSPQRGRG